MTFLVLASSAVGLGFLHGLGADHLMAIATLAVDRDARDRGTILRTAVGFAAGHAILLGLGATLAMVLGFSLPAAFEAGAEKLGGILLIVLGAIGAWGALTGRTFAHTHVEADGRFRWHLHLGRATHPHGHSRVPAALGAVFALSSLRALMLLEPLGSRAAALALPALLALVVLFGVGVLVSMSLFGVVLARVLSFRALQSVSRATTLAVAMASMLLGIYWVGA